MESHDAYSAIIGILTQIRARLILLLTLLACSSAVGYCLTEPAMAYLFKMVRQVVFITPTEAFVTKIKLALTIGFTLTLPVLLYMIAGAAAAHGAGLSKKTQLMVTLGGYLLFVAGAAFCLYTILPVALTFLLGFATLEMQPLLSAGRYISFVIMTVLMFGLAFELPLIILLLAKLGLLDEATLRQKRRYAILAIFIAAAVLTPSPDILSQILMALPLMALYEVGVLLTRFCRKRKEIYEMPADQQQLYM
ncbi:MAG: twin-arginine translocase subunit TatC [Negativicutes bacterium]|nr:twin-arginine translocase subunit TatC [Negativicutes bacterium]